MKNPLPVLYLVVPCYNEQDILPITSRLFEKEIIDLVQEEKIDKKSRILFVNDGSNDCT